MKKALALVLALVMLFALCACTATLDDETLAKLDDLESRISSLESAAKAAPAPAAAPEEEAPAEEPAKELDLPAVSLNYSSCFPDTHNFSILDMDRLAQLKEEANIDVTPYWNNALISATAPYTETLAGIADFTHIPANAETDHFVIDNAVQLFYYGTTDQQVLYETAKELYEQTPEWQAEYDGVVVDTWGVSGELVLLTLKEITSLEDVKGMSIRCTETSAFDLMAELGANPVRMPISELFEALSKGIVEGVVLTTESLHSTGLAELVKYHYPLGISGAFCPHSYISEASLNKLTPDQQEIFLRTGVERSDAEVAAGEVWEQEGYEDGEANGVVFGELPAEDLAQIQTIMEQLALKAVETINASGADGQAIYDNARAILAEKLG